MQDSGYNWIFQSADPAQSAALAKQLNISPVTAQILINRGIKDSQKTKSFFNTLLKELHDPFLMKDMEKAVSKIIMLLKEVTAGNKNPEKTLIDAGPLITVYGDYDVDGTTGTALIITFLREIGIKAQFYIPGRQSEGYGINMDAVRKIAASGARLIISVDCGISAYNEIVEAKKLGVDFIITDHHQVPEKIPPALAILNPVQSDCQYPYKKLSGVGVVFKLIMALRAKLREVPYFKDRLPNLKKHMDLVTLGTIADLAKMTGENRLMIRHGLRELTTTQKPGLIALKEVSDCHNKDIDTRDVGFFLGPRLNAAGRLETANKVVTLLISEDIEETKQIARDLNKTNLERQAIQAEIFQEAVELVESGPDLKESYTIVLASENWHPGVVGVVASKLINKYYRPTILIALDGEAGKASGRSIDGFNLYKNISKCSHLLEKYGGHEMAAGFSIKKELIGKFKKSFEEESHKSITDPKIFMSPLKIDAATPCDEITFDFFEEIEMLAPFGMGNPRPVLMAQNVTLPFTPTVVGKKGEHLKLKIKSGKKTIEAIGFNMGDLISKYDFTTNHFDIAFSVAINNWKNKKSIQLKLKDIRLANSK